MSTIQDVAKRAGVAPITASRVINHSGYVSDDVRQRVEAAVAELGYVPNSLARSLRSRRSHTLALVLTDITNPFFTTVARGVEDAAAEAGYMVLFCNSDESAEKELRYLDMLLQKRVDGLLIAPVGQDPAAIEALQRHDIPVVAFDRALPGARLDVVRCDSRQAAHQLTQHLLDLGHRRLALLTGPRGISTSQERAQGFQQALAQASLPPGAVYYGAFTQSSGAALARQALTAAPAPTALIAANNFIALGAAQALQALGLSIPADCSLAGFDDIPNSVTGEAFLTVAAQPAYEMGRQAALRLLALLGAEPGEAGSAPQEILLPTPLVVRRSSGPPPAH